MSENDLAVDVSMENGGLTEVGKIAITVSVLGGALLIAALISIALWYYRITNRRKKYYERYNKSLPVRSLSEIETELKQLHTSQIDLSKGSQPHKEATEVASPSPPPAATAKTANDSTPSSSPSSNLVVIRERKEDKSKVRSELDADTHLDAARTDSEHASYPLPDTRISMISSDVHSLGSESAIFGGYGGVLWPDVIDPYHRGQELELKIGGAAADMYNDRPLNAVAQFCR